MWKTTVIAAVILQLVAILSTVSSVAAGSRHGPSGGRHPGSSHDRGRALQHRAHRFHKDGIGGHRVFPRHFGAFGVVPTAPVIVYPAPLFLPSPPSSYTPPVYAAPLMAPPVLYSAPALSQPPPPPPRVVYHPTGRYELRGDGISTPYTWVWIPNPPPAPPTAPPAAAAIDAPTSGDAPPPRQPVYHWVDEHGVGHWTNRADRIPRRYLEEAKR